MLKNLRANMDTAKFQHFFDCCVGDWVAERTYHYLTHQEVERSRTEFTVDPLTLPLKLKVLKDNQYPAPAQLDPLPGYQLSFSTLSEKGEAVSQTLRMLFVPQKTEDSLLKGAYLRDRAYEEARPIVSQFQFNNSSQELLMTTFYSRVVSVDSIVLIDPGLRIRNILNYRRPPEGKPLQDVVLVGFGVEQKTSSS